MDLKKRVSKEDMQMANKQMKNCPLAVKEKPIKATVRPPHTH